MSSHLKPGVLIRASKAGFSSGMSRALYVVELAQYDERSELVSCKAKLFEGGGPATIQFSDRRLVKVVPR